MTEQTNQKVLSPYQEKYADDEIDLRELFTAIWQDKWLVVATTVIFSIGAVIFALLQPNIYQAQASLIAAENDKGGISGQIGQLGVLASLAGINLGTNNNSKTTLAMQIMQSRQFITNFIQKYEILPELMAIDKWHKDTNQIQYNADIYDPNTKMWIQKDAKLNQLKPSLQKAYDVFLKIYTVENDATTGLILVSIKHQSPYIAKQWVDLLIADINSEMKKRDANEAQHKLQFLEQQLTQTNVADTRRILYQLMESTTQILMFTNVRDEYVFNTIDPAIVAEEKSSPKRAFISVLGCMLGFALGVTIVLIRYSVKDRDPS